MVKKGTYVEISSIVLEVKDRSQSIPDDTKNTPLKMWARGNTLYDSQIGDEVEIETIIGRHMKGILEKIEPNYDHNFGTHISEIDYIGKQAKDILFNK